jgi:hypothetical protein
MVTNEVLRGSHRMFNGVGALRCLRGDITNGSTGFFEGVSDAVQFVVYPSSLVLLDSLCLVDLRFRVDA